MFLWFKTNYSCRTQSCRLTGVLYLCTLSSSVQVSVSLKWQNRNCENSPRRKNLQSCTWHLFIMQQKKNQWFKAMKRVLTTNELRKPSTSIMLPGQDFSHVYTEEHPPCTEPKGFLVSGCKMKTALLLFKLLLCCLCNCPIQNSMMVTHLTPECFETYRDIGMFPEIKHKILIY